MQIIVAHWYKAYRYYCPHVNIKVCRGLGQTHLQLTAAASTVC